MIKRILKDESGNMLPSACAIVLSLILVFSVVSEYMRLKIIASGIRDALQTSLISVATQNYDNLYNGLREGYSGGYYLNNSEVWEQNINHGDIYSNLINF